jgi:hypothetical protein
MTTDAVAIELGFLKVPRGVQKYTDLSIVQKAAALAEISDAAALPVRCELPPLPSQ